MLEVQRSDFLRDGGTCDPPTTDFLQHDSTGASVSGWKPTEKSVSFNRDVHVKRIGRGAPRVTAALAGDGEGRLIATPVHKESIASRSKEDLAQEAALVLQQVGSLHCVAHDNRRLPGRFSTLPARRNKKRPELPLDVRRRSVELGATSSADLVETPRLKKKALERSASDASAKKLRGPLARFFSPKLERKRKPVGRSVSDASSSLRSHRKRSGSESEGSHLGSSRVRKQLSPIIEASPHVDQQPFHFGKVATAENGESSSRPEAKKSKQEESDAKKVTERTETIETRERIEETEVSIGKPPISPRRENKGTVRRIPIELEVDDKKSKEETTERKEEKATGRTPSPVVNDTGVDEVDKVGTSSMLHSSRYDLQQRTGEESTIHKMIHRLSSDRSPPPQLTKTMVSPGPGFGHNNNRPFSYTRPNESCSSPPPQTNVIYAQVQTDKKKAQRSHSDSDEGLGLERKDSSRENSPAEKDYRRTDYSYSDLRRNNEINTFKSRYEEDRKNSSTHFSSHYGGTQDYASRNVDTKRRHEFDDIDRRLYDKPEKYTSTVFVDTSGRGRADGTDARQRDGNEFSARQTQSGISNKTSELSARRDLLESRIKSRLLADEMFAAKNSANVPIKKSEHEIIDKPIVPSPVTPNRVASPKRYMDTYITETRTNSNGEKYIFEKEIHEDNGKVYGYEKKITNKIPSDGYIDSKPRDGYTVETRTDKYGDKYIVETRTHEGYADDFKPFLSDRSRTSPEERYEAPRNSSSPYKSSNLRPEENTIPRHFRTEPRENNVLSSPIIAKKFTTTERKFSKSDDFLDRDVRPRDCYLPKKKNFESIRGMSKSTQRLDEVGENSRVRALRSEYTTRSHENLTSHADYVNARDVRRPLLESPTMNDRKERSPFTKQHLDSLREGPNDDYDTDISQMTSSQLESKYYKETRTTQRYTSSKHPIHDDYDSSPPRIRTDRGGYNSSRYDSDTTARDSIRCETRYDETSRTLRKEHRKLDEDPKKPLRRSRNRLDYFDDSDARESPRVKATVGRLETFDESPTRPPRVYHDGSKSRHTRQETRTHTERRHRETRLSDSDRKDRLADSGIENDYRRDSQEVDRREQIESEDEGFVTRQFIKHERRHTDRNMNLTPNEQRKYDKYMNDMSKSPPVTAKPPTGADKKYEKKAAKKSGTMSKVKQLFSKKEKKAKEEKNKKNARSNSSGALTDDEVTIRYREYRGDQLRSAKSARDLGSDINQLSRTRDAISDREMAVGTMMYRQFEESQMNILERHSESPSQHE
ncbi:bloated isoform X2 [Bombus vancouverensis nearcticus]|uniref:bloated isoform X2 n=1 Tax=Bombus vancouverensis nearcticus TaxID=2705178 RepID=UPI00402B4175